jgi:hypothetical protein
VTTYTFGGEVDIPKGFVIGGFLDLDGATAGTEDGADLSLAGTWEGDNAGARLVALDGTVVKLSSLMTKKDGPGTEPYTWEKLEVNDNTDAEELWASTNTNFIITTSSGDVYFMWCGKGPTSDATKSLPVKFWKATLGTSVVE